MKIVLALIAALSITACGGSQADDSNMPSTQAAVPCQQSKECIAREAAGHKIAVCSESFLGSHPVLMSTWDNGLTWVKGNCAATAIQP